MVSYLRRAVTFHLLPCILFLSTLREHKQSFCNEIPEVRCFHPSRAHVEKKRAGSMFVVSGSSTVFCSWTAGISAGPGRVHETAKDVSDFRGTAFNNREELYEDVLTVMKRAWTCINVQRYCELTLVSSSERHKLKEKRNSAGTRMIKTSNARFRAAWKTLQQINE